MEDCSYDSTRFSMIGLALRIAGLSSIGAGPRHSASNMRSIPVWN